MCVCIFCIVMRVPLSTLSVSFFKFYFLYIFITDIIDNISISMYITMLVQCLGRRFTNSHYYYYYKRHFCVHALKNYNSTFLSGSCTHTGTN